MSRKKRKSNTPLLILIGVLMIILAVFLLIAIGLSSPPDPTKPKPSETPPNTQSQPTNPPTTPTQTIPTKPTETEPKRSGWIQENGSTYYYEDGIAATGPYTIEGTLYCFGEDGALLTEGFQEVNGETYYLQADGSAHFGWLTVAENRYYFRENGTMAQGALEIDGQKYFFTGFGWQIYVVNPWNYVPDDYDPELVTVTGSFAKDGTKVEKSCYDALMQMVKDCRAAGHSIYITSSYRTHSYQTYLFNRQVEKQLKKGYSQEEAERIAATISAIPGTSEHQLGLAVDILDTEIWDLVQEQENLPGQIWLMENSWRYGFILRYPKDKTDETGIIYEPWHYRYVGQELAQYLYENNLTLETYLAALS